jgi:hypothetical protein
MPRRESRYPADWLRIAERDLARVDHLLDAALTYDPSLEPFRSACQKITGFYLVERYPFVIESGLTEEDVRTSWVQVEALIEMLRAGVAES